MNMDHNVFAPPEVSHVGVSSGLTVYPDASNGKRFLNYMLDLFFIYVLMMVVAIGLYLVVASHNNAMADQLIESPIVTICFYGLYPLYYLLFESLFGFTPGKLITGTRVVDGETHMKVGIAKATVRSLIRLIPFEPFSFFLAKAGGWHDHWSKTRTVDKRGTPLTLEEYQDMQSFNLG